MFFGSYDYSIDEKGRLVVPSKIRGSLGTNVYILKGYDGCVSLYTEETFLELTESLKSLPFESKESRLHARLVLGSVVMITIDKQGRLQFPQATLTKYNLKKEVTIVGVLDHLEIWDREEYQKYLNDNEGDFESNAEELLKHEKWLSLSVLLNEVIEGLNIKENGIYIDATLGRAGHSKEILKRLKSGLLVGIDQDDEALSYSKSLLAEVSNNFQLVKGNFRDLDKIVKNLSLERVDGILFDLGVSSPQFDEDYRGFSYRYNNKLDMRMNQSSSLTAKIVVNTYSKNDLIRVFKEYGEEKYANSIASNIVKYRNNKEIETTFELVDIIKKSKPMKELNKAGHPAKQVFQAIRIEVNDELNALKEGLNKALDILSINGRVAVISFHSLEDKIVKNIFRERAIIMVIESMTLNYLMR